MKVIGLTGGIASGKSSVAALLRAFGAAVLDSDAIIHDLLERGPRIREEVRRLFGPSVFRDGCIDRAALGNIVFADSAKRHQLEGLLHPQVKRLLTRHLHALEKEERPVVFIEVPLLFEVGWGGWMDEVWLVYAPPAVQRERLQKRSGLPEDEMERRLGSQWPWAEKLSRATRVIDNGGRWEETQAQVAVLCQSLLAEDN
jgi:dephospho-CoA kinase